MNTQNIQTKDKYTTNTRGPTGLDIVSSCVGQSVCNFVNTFIIKLNKQLQIKLAVIRTASVEFMFQKLFNVRLEAWASCSELVIVK